MIIAISLIVFFLLTGLIFIFTSHTLSPVPYFPTNKKDLPLILESLELKKDQIVFDLGAGDGIVLFEAAKLACEEKLDTTFVGVEINPVLTLILKLRRLMNPNRNHIKIKFRDMFTMNYQKHIRHEDIEAVFYLYISPWYLGKALERIKTVKNKKKRIVSYFYPIKSLSEVEKVQHGVHTIYTYQLQ